MPTAHILSAACLFDKSKVTPIEIARYWKQGTIVVCEKPNGQFGFIAGSSGKYGEVGDFLDCVHDQTGAKIGRWKIINEIYYRTDAETNDVHMTGVLGTGTVVKATVHVFK